jgi:urea carboxylase
MFERVLVANRGEIACRIARTLKRMGIATVAVYSEADRRSRHVLDADVAVCIGPGAAAASYMNANAVLDAARITGVQAVHPGYGFLSENADFAEATERCGLSFIGPTPEQLRVFSLKHTARELAQRTGVPLLPGSGLLSSPAHALSEAKRVGFPLLLKSSAGGGGLGMQLVPDEAEFATAFESMQTSSLGNFGDARLYLERFVQHARHLEVQLFGDGRGNVVQLGERDCSAQRRNQKVVEETPAPGLDPGLRSALGEAALALGKAVAYRSAGTVEFVYDSERREFYFLEFNARLQLEHGVTEAVTGIDLVEWMVSTAAGAPPELSAVATKPRGHAIEVRIYAEDPGRDFKPSAGLLTEVVFPSDTRVDTWVERGTEVTPFYDPLLAKVIAYADDRESTIEKLKTALDATAIGGIESNLRYLAALTRDPVFAAGELTTQSLRRFAFTDRSLEVQSPGTFSIIVDYPGRLGHWDVGIPPSGPMDDLAARVANRVVGNPEPAPLLELTMSGPTLRFACDTIIALAGASMAATLDDEPVPALKPVRVRARQTLKLGGIAGGGARTYLAVQGGFTVPSYLGSRTTFTLGGFGGHGGRALRRGDVLHLGEEGGRPPEAAAPGVVPSYTNRWEIGVLYGPHGAPDFFTEKGIETFFSTDWEVHYNSNRTGVRLLGPKPEWARRDGGEAGLHPSNIHDVAYAVGSVDFTGDMPILLGPDGPSLGGFVCPATVVAAELWKLGQLRPSDRVRFVTLSSDRAAELEWAQARTIKQLKVPEHAPDLRHSVRDQPILREDPEADTRLRVVYRQAGDKALLVEYGPPVLDFKLRFRVHALMSWLRAARLPGIIDLTPGIRSLQIHYDSSALPVRRLLEALARAETELPPVEDVEVPTRTVRLPLSWDDPATRLAISKYTQTVRPDAPWCPSNIEFIRRINGLEAEADVHRIVYAARYMVLGLGDVYLGAPVATPLDPRHRLVTTKYNPARTWTPENAVGIGGAYLCIYGMEGPGGYQFVGRTLQVYNRYRTTPYFAADTPWLLRFFDQISFYPVSAEELLEMREGFLYGKVELEIEEGRFRLRDYEAFLRENAPGIRSFKTVQQRAFEAERTRWVESGQLGPAVREREALLELEAKKLAAGARAASGPGAGT